MSTTPDTMRRPGGITLIVVLAVINAIVGIVAGIWVLLDHDDTRLLRDSGLTKNGLTGAGIVAIVLGVIGLFIALALGRGSRVARFLFGIWAVLELAAGLHALIAYHGEQQVAGAWSTAIGIVVLYLLYGSEKDREFFLHGR
jgi:hypothetical protein